MGFRGGPAGEGCGQVPGHVVRAAPDSDATCHLGAGPSSPPSPRRGSLPITPRKPSLTELAQPQKVATDVTVVLSHRVPGHPILGHHVLLSCAGAGGRQTLDPNPENVRGGQALQEAPWPCSSHSWGDEVRRQREARANPVPMSLSAGGSESSASWRGCLRPSCPPLAASHPLGQAGLPDHPQPFLRNADTQRAQGCPASTLLPVSKGAGAAPAPPTAL